MEHYKISKLLNDSTVSKFVTKKWIEVNDLSSGQYSVNKNIRFKTSMLRSDFCDYSNAYIVVKGDSVEGDSDAKTRNKNIIIKNNVPFRSCILKISNTYIENAEDLVIVIRDVSRPVLIAFNCYGCTKKLPKFFSMSK